MSSYLTHGLILGFIFFQAVVLVIVVSNLILLRGPRHYSQPPSFPLVSILVPARNEEATIAKCVQSLMGQD
ncbi:MAG: hypothetical protein FIA98_14100, partial [Anaerolineae bacterium]|nr:hypothetical protein [Anaerolineae bacterium]